MLGDLHVFIFTEFVSQDLNKFRVDLHGELLHLGDRCLQIGLGVAGKLLDLLVPGIFLAQLAGGQNKRGSCEL